MRSQPDQVFSSEAEHASSNTEGSHGKEFSIRRNFVRWKLVHVLHATDVVLIVFCVYCALTL